MATPVAALIVRVAADLAELRTNVEEVKGLAKTVGAALLGAFSLDAIGSAAQEAVDAAGRIQDAAERIGIGAEAVQRLEFAATQGGSSLEAVATAIGKMSDNLADPSKGAVAALNQLGLNVDHLRSLTPDEAFTAIADAIRGVPDPMQQSAIAVDLFGERALQLLPAIKAGISEVGNAAPLMKESMVQSGAQVGDSLDQMRQRIDNLKAQALLPLLDAFTTLPESLQVAAVGITEFMPSLESVGVAIMAAGGPTAALASLKAGALAVSTFFSGAFTTALAAIVTFCTTTLPAAFGAVIAFLGPQGLIALAVLALGAVWYTWGDDISAVVQRVYGAIKEWLLDKFAAVVQSVKEKVDAVTGFFAGMYDKVVGNSYVPDMIARVGEEFNLLDALMVDPAQAATDLINGVFRALGESVNGIIADMLGKVSEKFSTFAQTTLPQFGTEVTAQSTSILNGAMQGLMGGLTAGIGQAVSGLIDAGIGALVNHFQGGEEGRLVNPARDAFLLKYGPGGTGEGSGFNTLAVRLAAVGKSYLFEELIGAETMQQFNAAKNLIEQLPGFIFGSGGVRDFGTGTLAVLHGRERVQTEAQAVAEQAGVVAAIERIGARMERTIAKSVGRSLADALTKSPRLRTA